MSDIENICFEVDSCASNVTEFLELRKDHPPSSSSSIALSWVWEHVGRFGVEHDDKSRNHSSELVMQEEANLRSIYLGLTQIKQVTNLTICILVLQHYVPQIPSAPINQVPVIDGPGIELERGS